MNLAVSPERLHGAGMIRRQGLPVPPEESVIQWLQAGAPRVTTRQYPDSATRPPIPEALFFFSPMPLLLAYGTMGIEMAIDSCSRQLRSCPFKNYMNVVLNKSSQEPPFRNSFANLSPAFAVPRGYIFQNREFASGIKYMESSKFGYKLYNKSVVVYTNECGSNQNAIVIRCFFSLGAMPALSFFSRRQIAV